VFDSSEIHGGSLTGKSAINGFSTGLDTPDP
jgi:hypothetical protein